MTIARKFQVIDTSSTVFHCMSRCVRQAFLCGDAAEHRREWVREVMKVASGAFVIEMLAYAVMNNHLHLILRTTPNLVADWTDAEVIARWARAHPRIGSDGIAIPWSDVDLEARNADATWIATARLRLRSLSWFMKCVKERLARQANREDGCTGHFWEGRFKSIPLLDQPAIIACMVYVDLNSIRATIATTPGTSDFTSVQERIRARESLQQAKTFLEHVEISALVPSLRVNAEPTPGNASEGSEGALRIAPIASSTAHQESSFRLTLDDYLMLVDHTGRIMRSDKRGAIPTHLAPILERLNLDPTAWLNLMHNGGSFHGGAFGHLAARTTEALRRGVKWLVDVTRGLYRSPATSIS